MPENAQPKRRGRPPKYQGEGKRQNFSFRIRDVVRERLIAECQKSGRSISEEIELRLERSFEFHDTTMAILGEIRKMTERFFIESGGGRKLPSDVDFPIL